MADHAAKTGLVFGDEVFDFLRKVVELILPALGALYFTLSQFWGFPNAEEVVGSLAAVAVFGGVLLGMSRKSYNNSEAKYDGALVVDTTNEYKDVYRLELGVPFEEIQGKNALTLKVDNSAAE